MRYLAIIFILTISISVPVFANSNSRNLLVVEIMTSNNTSASAEYIEIYNPNDTAVDIEDYKVEYKSATGSDWSAKSGLEGKIGPRGRYLLVTSQLGVAGSATISSGMAGTGGHVRITKDGEVLDVLGWGNADSPEFLAAPVHAKEQSIKRVVDEDGHFIDTNDNSKDFFLSAKPSPSFDIYTQPAPAIPTAPTGVGARTSGSTAGAAATAARSYLSVELSELLIDPESPEVDKEDEFIELYNPNDSAVDLTKYKIQSGSTSWRYEFEFESKIIQPKSYLAIYSEESNLTLSNIGALVRLVDPNEKVLDGVSYEKAKAGKVLAKLDGKWGWSDSPTPGAANTTTDSSGVADSESMSENGFDHVAGVTSSKEKKDDESQSKYQEEDQQKSTIDTSVLVIVGGLAILYGLYEYRQNIRGAFTKLRRYYANRRKSRSAA